jgi:hypothetical protein
MAVPPTSPIRVFPQPVAVDVKGFMPQTNLFKEGMDAFQTGAKLPLLMEQIKHEKKRIKMENAKLDFAASEAGRAQQAEADQMARDLAAANVIKAQNEARASRYAEDRARAEAAEARNRAAGLEIVDRGPVSLTTAASSVGATVSPSLADMEVVAQEEEPQKPSSVLAGEALPLDFGTQSIRLSDETVEPPVAPPVQPTAAYVPKFVKSQGLNIVPVPGELGSRDASEYAREQISKIIQREFPPFRGQAKDEAAYNERMQKRISELEEKLEPTPTEEHLVDDRGIPILVPVVKVGNKVFDVVGVPRIDSKRLGEGQKKKDETFAARIAGADEAQRPNTLNNLNLLQQAAELMAEAEAGGNPAERQRALQLLPEWAKLLVTSKTAAARDRVRTVVQQSLRQTLGAQFARVEGEMMMDRAFNAVLGAEVNSDLLKNLYKVTATAIRDADAARKYFDANGGTLAGYQSPEGLIGEEHSGLKQLEATLAPITSKKSPTVSATSAIPEASQTYRKRRKRDE